MPGVNHERAVAAVVCRPSSRCPLLARPPSLLLHRLAHAFQHNCHGIEAV
jgi:hypothetical protein